MRNFIIGLVSLFIVGMVASASPTATKWLAAASRGTTVDAYLKGNYGSSGNILCNNGSAILFNSPVTCGVAPTSTPPANGQPLCGTSSTAASFEAPATCGLAVASNTPTASGDILCATSSSAASYETIGSCMNDMTLGVTDANHSIGWSGYPATSTHTLSYLWGNATNGSQIASSKRVQLFSDHGIMIYGGLSGGTNPPALVAGGGSADPSLIVVGSASGGALRLDKNATTAGTSISFSGRGTVSPSAVSCTASTCTSLGSATVTGAIVGAECITSRTTTAGAIGTNATAIDTVCGVTAANTVTLYGCNLTTGALAVTGTWSVRVFNP